ncbi:MAG: GNAT family N-acetyltransferase [Tannerellaceae bacterium]|jgi:RimJ/RimL family protein N-acetyltransferase|nr:GNAT family N-acetyltransferase [Tannerellaceae bacterium]
MPAVGYRKLTNSADVLLAKVEETYTTSFPEAERRSIPLFRELLDKEPKFNVYALLTKDKYIGFIAEWIFDAFVYVEHFAIDETVRNEGFGAAALQQFITQVTYPVVLEVELPTDELSRRRIGFYERLGFIPNNHAYQQPPYNKGDSWLPMRLMTYGRIDLGKNFDDIKDCLYKEVYKVDDGNK